MEQECNKAKYKGVAANVSRETFIFVGMTYF